MQRSTAAIAITGALIAAAPAHAQNAATVREIVRVVKVGPAGSALRDARIGAGLGVGDRVRTGSRSAAGLRFQDRSLLRVGELAEVVVTGTRRREARLERGRALMDFRTPGTIVGGYAVAAVRGTKVEYLRDEGERQDEIRSYRGRVFVAGSGNPIAAGVATQVTAATLTDPGLEEVQTDFTGGEVRFIDGPYDGQARPITAFNRAAGVVTFAPELALVPADARPTGYLLVLRPDRRVVELRDNMGTTVKEDEDPIPPFGIPHIQFARLERMPWYRELVDGKAVYVYPGTEWHRRKQEQEWPLLEAVNRITYPFCECGGRHLSPLSASPVGAASQVGGGRGGTLASQPDLYFSSQALEATEGNRFLQFRLEPYAVGSSDADAYGIRTRAQASNGDVYAELGYRYARFDGELLDGGVNEHDISEGFLHARGGLGDLIAGRQHVFLGPANNTNIGTLLTLDAVDAAVYELPLKRGLRQQFAYVFDSRSVEDGGFAAGYARGEALVGGGLAGYSVMEARRSGRQVGWSLDAAQPIIRNRLDVYAEGGVNTRGRTMATAGLYLPGLFQRARLDTFVEFGWREGVEEVVSLRLRKEFGDGLMAFLFLDTALGGRAVGGGGIFWSRRFR
jgi:hypothetical protein